jgi:hypothetical protein
MTKADFVRIKTKHPGLILLFPENDGLPEALYSSDELIDLLMDFGWHYELGYTWSMHFYPPDEVDFPCVKPANS